MDKSNLAQAARGLLENPVFQMAMQQAQQLYVDAWANSEHADVKAREVAYFRLKAIEDITGILQSYAAAPLMDQQRERAHTLMSN